MSHQSTPPRRRFLTLGVVLAVVLTTLPSAAIESPEARSAARVAPPPVAAPTAAPPDLATPPDPGDRLAAYRGLGTWVDIYDTTPWERPVAAVARMHRNGVRTLYVETANFHSPAAIHRPGALGAMIEAAHARGMQVVAWYLPSYANLRRDERRTLAAFAFTTRNGHRFDGLALDIESDVVRDIGRRNRRLRALTHRLRDRLGPDVPLGAIVPEAGALYWHDFPYRFVARHYDVFLPMAYYTFRVSGARRVRAWMARNIATIRTETRDPGVPIHVIGGLSDDTSGRELGAFVTTVNEHRVAGASLYQFETTARRHWRHLQRLRH